MITSRRSFLIGLGALVAAPAIVRAGSLMPVKQMDDWVDLVIPTNNPLLYGNSFILKGFDADGKLVVEFLDMPIHHPVCGTPHWREFTGIEVRA